MKRAKQIVNKVLEALEAVKLKDLKISGVEYPLLTWTEGNYECAMVIEPRSSKEFAIAVYGGYQLNKGSISELDETSDWYSKKPGFKDLEAAKKFFDEHEKIIKTKGGLANTGFPKGWGELYGMTDEVLAGLAPKSKT